MPHKDVEKRRAYVRERDRLIREGKHIPTKGNERKGDNLVCDVCKIEFYRSPANRNRNGCKGQYCSKDCMSKSFEGRFVGEKSPRWKGNIIEKPCLSCGSIIARHEWEWGKGKLSFCNMSCFGSWKSDNWVRENNPAWNGGHDYYYGANWVRQSYKARSRDEFKCLFCGLDEKLHFRKLDVHHIVPFRIYTEENSKKANSLSNLVSLCSCCHKYLEYFCADGSISTWNELKQVGIDNILIKKRTNSVDSEWIPRVVDFSQLDRSKIL